MVVVLAAAPTAAQISGISPNAFGSKVWRESVATVAALPACTSGGVEQQRIRTVRPPDVDAGIYYCPTGGGAWVALGGGGGGGSTTLAGLTDVDVTGAALGEPLVSDGAGNWGPAAAPAILEGDPPTSHAESHKVGGDDPLLVEELATTCNTGDLFEGASGLVECLPGPTVTPSAGAIPKAGVGGTLDDGWLSPGIARDSEVPSLETDPGIPLLNLASYGDICAAGESARRDGSDVANECFTASVGAHFAPSTIATDYGVTDFHALGGTDADTAVGKTFSGDATVLATASTSPSGECAQWDSSGNLVGAGGACGTGGGEANTASNLGGGLANFDSKNIVDLRFNTFEPADFDLASNLLSVDGTKWATRAAVPSLETDPGVPLLALSDLGDLCAGSESARRNAGDTANECYTPSAGGGAFSDSGDPIVANTTTKDLQLGDGAAVVTGKVEIGGDADQPQLVVEGFTTQTGPLFLVQTHAAGASLFEVANDGAVTFGGSTSVIQGNGTDDLAIDAAGQAITLGDGGTNGVQVTDAGAMTAIGAGSITATAVAPDAILSSSMGDSDHGDVSWTANVAAVENVQCTACVGAGEVDDGAAASTFALFSGGAGAASFRAIADGDVPDTITVDLATTATTATTANAGDSATAFFAAGQIEPARGGTGIDSSGSTGVLRVAAGTWSANAGVSHLASSTSADLAGVLSDETGTGVAVFAADPALTGNPTVPTASANDDDTSAASTAYVQGEINGSGGRSLTCASGNCDADVELYRDTKIINIDPTATTTDWFFFRTESAITITGIDCIVDAATSVVLTLRECDANGGSCAATEAAITCATTNTTEAAGIDDAVVAAGVWMRVLRGTVTGSPTQAVFSVIFEVAD
jgi:hypothetical protein